MGIAYLPDGSIMDYNDYIRTHPYWQSVRRARFAFDSNRCAICHKDLTGQVYQTHHIRYQRLGHEHIRDVITLCPECHRQFHQNWTQSNFWKGKESGHWEMFSLEHTALLCHAYWRNDRFISRDPDGPNLCREESCRDLLDDYFRDFALDIHPVIDPHDISLFIRNKRYELFFDAERKGMTVEQFLDDYYGEKVRGKNPLRRDAGKKNGPFDHTPEAFHRHYQENKNINILMNEVKKLETEDMKNAETYRI